MRTFNEWKHDHLSQNLEDADLDQSQLFQKYNDYISERLGIKSLLSHRVNLRRTTAYPILRVINLLNSVAIVFLSLLWGNGVGREQGLIIFGIVGIIVAILSYSLTSVFFDVTDSNINTSRNSEGKS